MAKVIYLGPYDVRELGKADFTNLGVDDQTKLTFNKHEVVEVSDAVAAALVSHNLVEGEFEVVADEAVDGGELEAGEVVEPTKKAAKNPVALNERNVGAAAGSGGSTDSGSGSGSGSETGNTASTAS